MCIKWAIPVTIKDIAALAGVSHPTVSRSLNDSPLIPPETRERIKAIARAQGFELNAMARSLSRGKSSCIAVIYPEYFERPSINLFFSSLLGHVRHVFEREGIDVMVSFPRNLRSGASNIQRLARERKVDGMLIVNNEIEAEDLACLAKTRIPYVFLHKHPTGAGVAAADYFCADHAAGGRLAGEALLSRGRRRLLCVSAIGEEFDARSSGFEAALTAAGLALSDADTLYGDCSFEYGAGEAAVRAVLGGYDGVFCQTDLMALGLVRSLVAKGKSVPGDIAVVGYDDIELGAYASPSLTTIRQPLDRITALACERLIALLSGEGGVGPMQLLVAPGLVQRES